MSKLQLSFHGTFVLKKEDLLKMLSAAQEPEGLALKRADLEARTGLGNEKVLRIKSWAMRCGLVDKKHLTPAGKIIIENDPYLEHLSTEWFMHLHLSFGDHGITPPPLTPDQWGGWTYFIFDFLKTRSHFTLDSLTDQCLQTFDEPNRNPVLKNLRILLRTYTETEAIAQPQILTKHNKDEYHANPPNLPPAPLIGYALSQLWQRDFPDQTSLLTEKILTQPYGLCDLFRIDPDTLQTHLNHLETLGIVEQRRTVPPNQIVRRWSDPLHLLAQAYS
jgi:hypothetical protein